jgi:hypothetical protein
VSYDENQAIANEDYRLKREVLSRSGFRLSLEAAAEDTWTRETIERRTRHFTHLIFGYWGLEADNA